MAIIKPEYKFKRPYHYNNMVTVANIITRLNIIDRWHEIHIFDKLCMQLEIFYIGWFNIYGLKYNYSF